MNNYVKISFSQGEIPLLSNHQQRIPSPRLQNQVWANQREYRQRYVVVSSQLAQLCSNLLTHKVVRPQFVLSGVVSRSPFLRQILPRACKHLQSCLLPILFVVEPALLCFFELHPSHVQKFKSSIFFVFAPFYQILYVVWGSIKLWYVHSFSYYLLSLPHFRERHI